MQDRFTVTVAVDGGIAPFPGLARPFTVDAAELPPDEAAELARLVEESGFFELPEQPAQPGDPDARTYTVTVQRGSDSRTLTLTDPLPNSALRQLINLVEKRRRAR
jgi:hypothetical protein